MNNLYLAHKALRESVESQGLVLEQLHSEPQFKVWFVASNPEACLRKIRGHKYFCESYAAGGGWAIVLSAKAPERTKIDAILESLGTGNFASGLHQAFFMPTKAEAKPKTKLPIVDAAVGFEDQIEEALDGMAVPDGSVQPQDGVKMLQKAMNAPTKAGITLKQALQKAGVTWNVAEGKHLIVFSRDGQEQWRVEPFSLADSKVFEETLSALWSIANGKAPNARDIDHEAKKLAAQQARDAESEITDLVKSLSPTPEQPVAQNVATR